jgi:hypothetical protein
MGPNAPPRAPQPPVCACASDRRWRRRASCERSAKPTADFTTPSTLDFTTASIVEEVATIIRAVEKLGGPKLGNPDKPRQRCLPSIFLHHVPQCGAKAYVPRQTREAFGGSSPRPCAWQDCPSNSACPRGAPMSAIGPLADMALAATNVGFGGKADITMDGPECPLMTAGSTGRRNTHCPGGKDGVFDDTSRIFSRLHCGRANGDFEPLASDTTPWDSNPSRKNEIECCVDRLNPPPKADIK